MYIWFAMALAKYICVCMFMYEYLLDTQTGQEERLVTEVS